VIADRCRLRPDVDAGAPDVTASLSELICRVKHRIRGKEGGELTARPAVRLVDLSAGDASSDAYGGALRCGSAEWRGDGERDGNGVVAPSAHLEHDSGANLNRATRKAIGGVTRVVTDQELLEFVVTPDLCGRVGRVAR
jgi:hypothetical protein